MNSKPLFLLLILIFISSSLSAQWEWLNPYPQGTNLWKIVFVEGSEIGYALGSYGNIIKTTDGGISWKAMSSPAEPRLDGANAHCGISFITPELGYFGGKYFVKTTDGGKSWEVIGSDLQIYAMDFRDEDLGFVAMDTDDWEPASVIYKVTEGGHNWEELPPNPLHRIERLIILDDSSLIIVGYQGKVVFPNYNYYYSIALSEDLGQTWTDTIFDGYSGYLRDIEFKDSNIGYACGAAGFIVKTVDGGRSWERMNYDPEISPISIGLYGDSIITMTFDGASLISTDNGVSWDSLGLASDYKMEDLAVNSRGDCIAVGNTGVIKSLASSTDSWKTLSRNVAEERNEALLGIHFPSQDVGYICGWRGNIFKTSDGGDNWTKLYTGESLHLRDIFCIDDNLIYAVGGDIIRSSDGGQTWEKAFAPTNKVLAKISFVDNKHGFATGSNTTVYKTDNGGWSWRNVSPDHGWYEIYDHYFFDSLNGIVVGSNQYYAKTSNGGQSWQRVNIAPDEEGNIWSLSFPTPNTGYAITSEWNLYKTTDGGQSWNTYRMDNREHGFLIFMDENTGYMVDNVIRKTEDGGMTWFTDELSKNLGFKDMFMAPNGRLFACGYSGMIMMSDKYLKATNIDNKEFYDDFEIDLWPNPATDKLNISLTGLSGKTLVIKLISITGAESLLYNARPENKEINEQLDVAGFPRGIYILKIRNGNNLITRKILIL